MPYTDAELEALVHDLEADWVERKSSFGGDAPARAREAVCAFANDLADRRKDGVLLIGVHDDGTPSGLEITERLLDAIADIRSDGRTLPPPMLTVEKRRLKGADVVVVLVHPSDSPPVKFDGRIWIRVGARRAIANADEERRLNERRLARAIPFDAQPCLAAVLEDLDTEFVRNVYLPSAVARDLLEMNERTIEQQMTSLKLLSRAESGSPTNMGVLGAATSPQSLLPGAYVEFRRVDGRDLTDRDLDSFRATGRVSDLISRIEDKFASHNRTSVSIDEAIERRRSTYPPVAFQQLFRNAIMHRNYEHTHAPVRVTWYADRLEIWSPGGTFGVVSPENIGEGPTDYRNPNLAEAMRNLGYAQKFGLGIARAQRELHDNGNPPARIEARQNAVLVTMWQ
jgi:ATP-dependent DNA helicase RecG